MNVVKDSAITTTETTTAVNPATSEATSAQPRIHWAGETDPARKLELEAKFEAMRARNWITERMVEQYQKHWHCSREAALERLLAKVGA